MLVPGVFNDVLMVVGNGHPLDCAYLLHVFISGSSISFGGMVSFTEIRMFLKVSAAFTLPSVAFAYTASTVLTWICICFACFCLLWVYENMLDMLHDILLPTLGVVFRL